LVAPPAPATSPLSTSPSVPVIYALSLHDALPIFNRTRYTVSLALQVTINMVLDGKNSTAVVAERIPVASLLLEGEVPTYYSGGRSEEHTSELQSRFDLVCRLLLQKKNSSRERTHV